MTSTRWVFRTRWVVGSCMPFNPAPAPPTWTHFLRPWAFVADLLGCASSRHDICACAHRRRPLQPLPSCFSRLAPPPLEGEGSLLQRPASDVFYPRFSEVRVVRGGSMIGELLCSSSSQIQWLRSLASSAVVVVVVVSLRPLTRRNRPALEGPHGGRHLSVSTDRRRVRVDSAEPPETPLHEGRAPEQDVARGVRFLAAHGAPARRAVDVWALRQLVLTLFWAVRLLPVSLNIG